MKSYDFEYDGLCLSDMGYIICQFDAESSQTVSNGSQITFNTTSTLNGSKYEQTSSEYGECLETTIQICKNPCLGDDMEIPFKELRDLMSWLNRKEFHKLKFLDGDYLDLYFEASFNVSRIELNGKVYGLELAVTTNRPFALREPRQIIVKNLIKNGFLYHPFPRHNTGWKFQDLLYHLLQQHKKHDFPALIYQFSSLKVFLSAQSYV